MTSRTLRKDVSEIPVLVEPAAMPVAETFVPRPSEPPSAESPSAESPSAEPPSAEAAAEAGGQPLSERERAVLSFEKRQWKYSGAKEQAIRDRFELSADSYYQLLNRLLDRPEAQALEPALIKRLRRLRDAKRQARSGHPRPRPA
jgi:hypothetical protein